MDTISINKSVLFVTLDSCRYDTFVRANTPNIDKVGSVFAAWAPSNFTFGSHSSMFMGFTPGNPKLNKPIINPKWGKMFRLTQGGIKGKGEDCYTLSGRNIIDGFKNLNYYTIGTGAVGWFNPDTLTSKSLIEDFDSFYYPGNTWSLHAQLSWIYEQLSKIDKPVFLFLNIGETHVPYYYEGATWSKEDNPCIPFSELNDRQKCIVRQKQSLEYVDFKLKNLLETFSNSTILICADHGDCWGEDGLWEHGITHEKVLKVPLLFRLSPNLNQ